jgi:hypothetical protein
MAHTSKSTSPPNSEKVNVPKSVLPDYAKEAARLGCERTALYRVALKRFVRSFPLKKELVLT